MRSTVVESNSPQTKRKREDAGLDERQAKTAEVTETAHIRTSLERDVDDLKRDVRALKEAVVTNERFESFREELTARLEATEHRVRAEIAESRAHTDTRFASVRGQISELRTETRGEFRAARREIAELRTELRGEIAKLRTELRGEMAELQTELRGEMTELRTELRGEMTELRTEVRGDIEGLRLETTARFESLDSRLKLVVGLLCAGLTLYTGTTVSLMLLLFRSMVG